MPDLWVMESDGGNPRRITEDSDKEWLACWSADPGFLYFGKYKGGIHLNYRIPMSDSGESTGPPELWARLPEELQFGQWFDVAKDSVLTSEEEHESDIWMLIFR